MRKRMLFFVLLASAGLSFGQSGYDGHLDAKPAATKPSADAEYSRFETEMKAGMSRMMKDMHSSGYTGNPDIDFLALMIPHHQGAVEMARLVLVHGRDPATRRLAEDIIASQTVEIEGMKRRLAALHANPHSRQPEFPELGGTRGPGK
jgi:uncharacterized protein (DUF305 family)